MREYFKGVVWPRARREGPVGPNFPYVLVGMLVTDQELTLVGNEIVLCGSAHGLGEAVEAIPRTKAPWALGTADSVLDILQYIQPLKGGK